MFVPHQFYNNILDYGVDNTGTVDCSTKINSALSVGGYWFFPSGTYLILSPLNLTIAGTIVAGAGYSTRFNPTGFSGSQLFNISSDYCSISDI